MPEKVAKLVKISMKSSVTIAITLTLLMLLLVALAAVFFLFTNQTMLVQERDQAQLEAETLNVTKTALEFELNSASVTQQAQETRVAGLEADTQALDSQLVESGQTATAQAVEVTRLNEALTAVGSQGPILSIISPPDNTVAEIGQEVRIIVSASDPSGVAEITAEIDDQPFSAGSGETSATLNEVWIPTTDGTFTLTVNATNTDGVTAVEQSITVVVQPEPTATPTPTTTPSPTQTPSDDG